MLVDRGLDASSFDTDRQLEVQEVVAKSRLSAVFEVDVHSAKVRVIYNLNTKYKAQDINKLKKQPVRIDDDLEDPAESSPSEWQYLIVTRELPMQGKSTVDENTQLFRIDELLINVSKHSLVPRHIPIRSPDDIKKILQIYSLKTPQQLPLILSTDPQARYLALKPGELVRIERPSPSAGTYVLYRCCHKA
jgi:DNA-directed RNA polymerase I, II, and III subunit RPABC1